MNRSVGIVTRTKDRPIFLRRAIESVKNQTYKNWKHVIINDGGAVEPVEELVEPYRKTSEQQVEVLHNPKSLGMEAASNKALSILDTDLVAIHDDDDSWSPEFLSQMVSTLSQVQRDFPSVKGIICYTSYVNEEILGNLIQIESIDPFGIELQPSVGLLSLDQMLIHNTFPPISFLYERKVLDEIGNYNEALPVLGDWDFNIRFLLKYDIWVHPERLAFYHLRFKQDGILGNSVIAQGNLHKHYNIFLKNQFMRNEYIRNGIVALRLVEHDDTKELKDILFRIENHLQSLDHKLSYLHRIAEILHQLARKTKINLPYKILRKFIRI